MTDLCRLCGFPYSPEAGDVFFTRGGDHEPCCREYLTKAGTLLPDEPVDYLGSLEQGTVLHALAVEPAFIPNDRYGNPPCWGISVQVESAIRSGATVS